MRVSLKQNYCFSLPWDNESIVFPSPYEKIALFGAGGKGGEVADELKRMRPDLDLVCFIDNFARGSKRSIPIYSLDEFLSHHSDVLVIITSLWERAISEQLLEKGVKKFIITRNNNRTIPFSNNPQPCNFFIDRIDRKNDNSIVLSLAEASGTPLDFRYRIQNEASKLSDKGTIHVRSIHPEKETIVSFQPVNQSSGEWHTLSVKLYPSPYKDLNQELLRQAPQAGFDSVLIFLNGVLYRPESWLTHGSLPCPDEDSQYVKFRWQSCINKDDSYKTMVQIGSTIIKDCEQSPKDFIDVNEELSLTPIKRLRNTIKGTASMKCGNYAEAMAYIGEVLGYPVRQVQLVREKNSSLGSLLIGGGHVVNEMFCPMRSHWIFFDIFYQVLGARIGDCLLSTSDLFNFVHSSRKDAVELLIYHAQDGRPQWRPFMETYIADLLNREYGQQQHLFYPEPE